jgi:hypothetical protein
MHSPGEVRSPAWSPNGRQIAFDAAIRGNSDIYMTNSEGGSVKRLTFGSSIDRFPSWSKDGRWIYYSSEAPGLPQVMKVSADGGQPVQITRNGGFEPIISFDGESVYYLDPAPQVTGYKVKRVPADGGEEMGVVEGVRHAHWAVYEKGIFFLAMEEEFDAIDFYSFSDRKITRVGRLPFRVVKIGDIGRFTVSRDGRSALTLAVDRWEQDLMIVDNFR